MKSDNTRDTFQPDKNLRTVRYEQGRVPLDSELNESQDIIANRIEEQARDVIGPEGAPLHDAGFGLEVTPGGELLIGSGNYYVQGLLCQLNESVNFEGQSDAPGLELPESDGVYVAYLEAWLDHQTSIELPEIREVALHGAETTSRQRVACPVDLLQISNDPNAEFECPDDLPGWDGLVAPPTGRLAARAEPAEVPADACSLTPGAGYRRLENQLYRIEIHTAGNQNSATFKWSRENGSIVSAWVGQSGSDLRVSAQPRDPMRVFAPGDWVELIDRSAILGGRPGTLVRVTNVDGPVLTIDPATATGSTDRADFPVHPMIRRWESVGEMGLRDGMNTDNFIPLEDGVEVRFANGTFDHGDYWLIPARTVTGDVEWPINPGTNQPALQRRRGTVHHFARLALLKLENGVWSILRDCRRKFLPLTWKNCCTIYVGDGVTSFGHFDSLREAFHHLPQAGGTICVLPGQHRADEVITNRSDIVIKGCGMESMIVPTESEGPPILLTFKGCQNITIRSLAFHASEGTCLYVEGREQGSRQIKVENCEFIAGRVAVAMHDVTGCEIVNSRISLTDTPWGSAALSIQARNALIEKNTIQVVPSKVDRLVAMTEVLGGGRQGLAWGGIHLHSGSSEVRVVENSIIGGSGHGITLGGNIATHDVFVTVGKGTKSKGFAAGKEMTFQNDKALILVIDSAGEPRSKIPVTISGEKGSDFAVTDQKGEMYFEIGKGKKMIHVGGGQRILHANHRQSNGGIDVVHVVTDTVKEEKKLEEESLFLKIREKEGDEEKTPIRDFSSSEIEKHLPLTSIRIQRNLIGKCGLSGIGVLPTGEIENVETGLTHGLRVSKNPGLGLFSLPSNRALLRGAIRDLEISQNEISDTYRRPLSRVFGLAEIGYGGISLGAVSQTRILNNRILGFGDPLEKPVCGIFISLSEGLDISENEIRTMTRLETQNTQEGFTGGVVCRLSLNYSAQRKNQLRGATAFPINITNIRDNVVSVPAGRALTLTAFGDVRCQGNTFETNIPGPNGVDFLVGNTLIVNLGGLLELVRLILLGKEAPDDSPPNSPGNFVPNHSLGSLAFAHLVKTPSEEPEVRDQFKTRAFALKANNRADVREWYQAADTAELPKAVDIGQGDGPGNPTTGGPDSLTLGETGGLDLGKFSMFLSSLFGAGTHFAENRLVTGLQQFSLVSHAIIGLGDISYTENKSSALQLHPLPSNGVLASSSLRSANNRLLEAHLLPGFSMICYALGQNVTTGNQLDHCLLTKSGGFGGLPITKFGNQVLLHDLCAKIFEFLQQNLPTLFAGALEKGKSARGLPGGVNFDELEAIIGTEINQGEETLLEWGGPQMYESLLALHDAREAEVTAVEAAFGKESHHHQGSQRLDQERPIFTTMKNVIDAGEVFKQGPEEKVIKADSAIVEGRVVLADHRGIKDVVVTLVTENGKELPVNARTTPGGLFRMELPKKILGSGGKVERLRLRVRSADGKKIFHESESTITAKSGAITNGEVRLSRENILGKSFKLPQPEPLKKTEAASSPTVGKAKSAKSKKAVKKAVGKTAKKVTKKTAVGKKVRKEAKNVTKPILKRPKKKD